MRDPFTGEDVLDQETGKPVEDPSVIEQWSEKLRASVGELTRPMPAGTVKSPDDIVRDLDELDRIASQVVAVTREADKTRRAAKRMLTKARLRAPARCLTNSSGNRQSRPERNSSFPPERAFRCSMPRRRAKCRFCRAPRLQPR